MSGSSRSYRREGHRDVAAGNGKMASGAEADRITMSFPSGLLQQLPERGFSKALGQNPRSVVMLPLTVFIREPLAPDIDE
jgi:hypothetical protein